MLTQVHVIRIRPGLGLGRSQTFNSLYNRDEYCAVDFSLVATEGSSKDRVCSCSELGGEEDRSEDTVDVSFCVTEGSPLRVGIGSELEAELEDEEG